MGKKLALNTQLFGVMASKRYKSLVFSYSNDSGQTSIKHQKLDIDAPVVPLLAAKEYTTNSKLESMGNSLRHLNLTKDEREINLVIPYAPDDLVNLKAYIQQVAATPDVINPQYVGESSIKALSS